MIRFASFLSLCLTPLLLNASEESAARNRRTLSLGARPIELPQPSLQPPSAATIELALCLDTSGSMDHLINAAREKLWGIVNEMALAQPAPKLRVALLTYGHDSHDAKRGWVKIDAPFTEDLDAISEQLFALTTNGGTEYVARVVRTANLELDWSADPGALRLIVVAGNEAADQDQQFDSEAVAGEAITRGIQVNTLYCNASNDSYAAGWAAVARRADGFYSAIDPAATHSITSPFDGRLAELSGFLNSTYVPMGEAGARSWANQTAQDLNAASLNGATAAARAKTKAGKLYRTEWDLVQRSEEKGFEWKSVRSEDLPEELRGKSQVELQKHVAELVKRRRQLSSQIEEVSKQRAEWVAEQSKEAGKGFDGALLRALRNQASAKGWAFPAPAGSDAPVKRD